MNAIKVTPEIKFRTSLKIDPDAGHSVHVFGATPPKGERFLLTDCDNVEVYYGPNCVASFPCIDFCDFELHPQRDLIVGTGPGVIDVLDYSGSVRNQISVPFGRDWVCAGFDCSGTFFYAGHDGERVQTGCVSSGIKFDGISKLPLSNDQAPVDEYFCLGQPQQSDWRYLEIDTLTRDTPFSVQLFRCLSSSWEWGALIEGVQHNIALSPDNCEYVTTLYDEYEKLVSFQKGSLSLSHEIRTSGQFAAEQPAERCFYIDLVRVIVLTYDGRIFILHTGSMVVEWELIIEGVSKINQLLLCGESILILTLEGELIFVDIEKVCRKCC